MDVVVTDDFVTSCWGRDERATTGQSNSRCLEPKVTITPSDGERIIEYRANGRVFMVKVQPVKGPAYFLVDSDGDGSLETKRFSIKDEAFALPHWVLFRW